ncbi:uncharacterized protein C12orf42 homolog isoform X2 [Artibeus jamaicensis]|uniref:uncharacterized protein C12orf42 homolog isoform X2 n=1 Tax=Artibeus jamaicensis TaxID=9417 RepID=UPI00235B1891|nr:uncharacterized protein C12orf42 homolog isoform X2 [Artibeus jamaicensis]
MAPEIKQENHSDLGKQTIEKYRCWQCAQPQNQHDLGGEGPAPRRERTASPCSRVAAHTRNFSESLKLSHLGVPHFPGRTQTPMSCKKLLCTHQNNTPSCPAVSIAPSKEQSHGEVSPFLAPSSAWDKTPLIFTVNREIHKRDRGAPKQSWSCPFVKQQMAEMPMGCYSVYPVCLEAVGTHISRHVRARNQPSPSSKRDSVPPGPAARPSTVLGICRRSQISGAPLKVSGGSSESQMEERMAAEVGALANPDSLSALQGAPESPVGRGAVAMAPETLPKHPHPPGKRGPRADASLPGNLAGAPLSQFAGSATQLPSKGLIKAWSCPPMRPPQRFQTACSQAPPWPGVNAH